MKGKLIVIDGTDGSGKTTQTELLIERLKKEGHRVETMSFPRYGTKACGPVEEYLAGKYGTPLEVGPYRGSVLFTVDRYDASFDLRKWLDEGAIVVLNRYVAANMGHQAGKITDPIERKKFIDWLYEFEYGMFNLPKPDLNLILHVAPEISMKLVDTRGNVKDAHEKDPEHIKAAEQAYLEIAKLPGFQLIECVENNEIMSREKIQELVWGAVESLLK